MRNLKEAEMTYVMLCIDYPIQGNFRIRSFASIDDAQHEICRFTSEHEEMDGKILLIRGEIVQIGGSG